MADPCLAELGEEELIRRLGAFAPPGQFNDDAAVLPLAAAGPGQGGEVVVNTDVLVEGVHFSETTTAAEDVGWRAAAANLSDLAAMGCTEVVGLTVGLVAPGATPWAWVEGVYRGLDAALAAHGGRLLGGDCSGGGQRVVAVTAIGRVGAPGGLIRRGDGRPGDQLVCTGSHGLSRLGLELLLNPGGSVAAALPPGCRQRAIQAHRRPTPRFDALAALASSRPGGSPWRVGGCDSSDGLAAAVAAIGRASGCGALLRRDALPMDPCLAALAAGEAWCLGGGEDFELVLALAPAWAEALLAALPGSTRIGALAAGEAGSLGWSDGGLWPPDGAGSGYSHFS